MAEIEIGPLSDRLSDEEIRELRNELEKLGAPPLPGSDDAHARTFGDVDDDVLTEFLDRLEAHEMACELYLPIDFEGRVEVGELRVGSSSLLLEVLEEVKEDLGVDEEEEDLDDEEEGAFGDVLASELRECWKVFHKACNASLDQNLPMHVKV